MRTLLMLGITAILWAVSCSSSLAIGDANSLQEVGAMVSGEHSFSHVIGSAASTLGSIWRYKITTIDNQAITVSNLIIGIILFAFGLWFCRYLSKFVGRKLQTVAHLEVSVAAALEKISYYVFLVLMTLLVLDVSNVPLTVFTFVGGALAIGIGFGSQNIISNFISGLILLVERPIRIGDLIEVNNTVGKVISIGARCTHLRTGSSVDILVPNSSILEKTVVNWTLNDEIIRDTVAVGVAYGSPTHKVESILFAALEQTEYILEDPKPQVYFVGFGDSTLNFEIFLWVDLSGPVEKKRVISNLNHTIDRLCRENDIVFAFPQRDVNLKIAPEDAALIEKFVH